MSVRSMVRSKTSLLAALPVLAFPVLFFSSMADSPKPPPPPPLTTGLLLRALICWGLLLFVCGLKAEANGPRLVTTVWGANLDDGAIALGANGSGLPYLFERVLSDRLGRSLIEISLGSENWSQSS